MCCFLLHSLKSVALCLFPVVRNIPPVPDWEHISNLLTFKKLNLNFSMCSHAPPERKLVPSVSDAAVPSHSAEVQPPPRSSIPSILSHTLPHSTVPKWVSVTLLTVKTAAELVHFRLSLRNYCRSECDVCEYSLTCSTSKILNPYWPCYCPGRGQRPAPATTASPLRLRGDTPCGATPPQRGLGHPPHIGARAETPIRWKEKG